MLVHKRQRKGGPRHPAPCSLPPAPCTCGRDPVRLHVRVGRGGELEALEGDIAHGSPLRATCVHQDLELRDGNNRRLRRCPGAVEIEVQLPTSNRMSHRMRAAVGGGREEASCVYAHMRVCAYACMRNARQVLCNHPDFLSW